MARGLDSIYRNRKFENKKTGENIREYIKSPEESLADLMSTLDSMSKYEPEIDEAVRRVREMDMEKVNEEEKDEGINKSSNGPDPDDDLPFTSSAEKSRQDFEELREQFREIFEEETKRQEEIRRQEELRRIEEQKRKEEEKRKEAERKKREEIENKIDKLYSDIISKMDNIYKTPILEDQISSLNRSLDEIMMRNDLTIEDLNKTFEELTKLSPKVDSLFKEASDIKIEDQKINEQATKQNEVSAYQEELKGKYGTAWFTKISEEEKAKYVELYSTAHGVSKESVEKNIEDSIALWNREHPSVEKEPVEKEEQKPLPGISNWDEEKKTEEEKKDEKPAYEWEAKETFKFETRRALNSLKEMYYMLGSATPEQLITYKACYDTLSNIWKSTPTSIDDERRIMTNLFNVRDTINNLKNELSTIEYGSQSGGMGL